MPSPMPSVGAVAFCLNEQAHVRPTVEELVEVQRSHREFREVVLVDDGSTDATWAAMTALSKAHPFVKAVRHETNLGVTEAVATGAAHATTDYLLIVPGDLTYESHALDSMLMTLRRSTHKNVVVLGLRPPNRVRRSIVREIAASVARASLFWVAPKRGVLPNYGLIMCPTWVVRAVPDAVRGYGQAVGLLGVVLQCGLPIVTTPVEQVPGSHTRGSKITADKIADIAVAHLALWRTRRQTKAIGRTHL